MLVSPDASLNARPNSLPSTRCLASLFGDECGAAEKFEALAELKKAKIIGIPERYMCLVKIPAIFGNLTDESSDNVHAGVLVRAHGKEHPMKWYRCWYVRDPMYVNLGSRYIVELYHRTGSFGEHGAAWPTAHGTSRDEPQLFTITSLPHTHVMVYELLVESREQVYGLMQAERMSPDMLDRFDAYIEAGTLTHTSMSVGDVVEDSEMGTYFECEMRGWRQLTP
jgi:hypothetical protein